VANKNFVVKNGLTVGNLTVDADSGDLITSGNLSVASISTDSFFYANGTPFSTAGALGYTGSQGAQGIQGVQGTTGFVGSRGVDGTIGVDGYTGSKGDTGLGFRIAKSYISLSALLADTSPTGIVAGEFALIETGNVQDADNSKLYLWTGSAYTYVTDLSGAAGITGPAGNTGFTGSAGAAGFTGSAGAAGTAGTTGTSGFTGSAGAVGAAGFAGSAGFTGSSGALGFTGSSGSAGFTGSIGLLDWAPITGNHTAVNRQRLLLNSSSGSFTLTLPAAPATGTYIQLTDGANLATNPVTVNRNGSTIESSANNLILDVPNATFEFIYDGTTWQFTSTSGPRGDVGYTGSVGFMGSAGLQDWIVVNSTHTAVDKQRLIVDTSAGAFTLTLPITPAVGTYVQITDGANLLTNPLTVARNGSTIEGIAQDFVMDVPNATFEFIYDGATWQVTSTVGPRGEAGYTGSVGFTGSVGLLDWAPITGNYTAVNRERLMLNSSGGPFTLTLPATPATGTYIQLTDGANLATNPVVIARNGSTIESSAADLSLDTPNATFEFIYDGATWQVTSTAGPRGLVGFTGSRGTDGIIGTNGFTGSVGFTGSQGQTGLGFRVAKSYVSVAALTADTAPTGIVAGEFAIIETGSVNDPDNSKLYLWSGTAYSYVTDLSGAAGITGPAGTTGFTGSAGAGGTAGTSGAVGFTGSVGFSGSAGSTGFVGSASTVAGFTGSAGNAGFAGSTGFTGSTGGLGFTGSAGVGFAGSAGSDGFVGSTGFVGSAGSLGFTGSAGAGFNGSAGFVGSRGFAGDQGAPGIASSSVAVDVFTGTGSQTAFTLSVTPTGINQTWTNIDGVGQIRSSYTLSGSTLTFTEAPANGAEIEVTIFVYGTSAFVNRTYTGDGTTTNFAVTSGVTASSVIVNNNGLVQQPGSDYTVSGTTLTFLAAPFNGAAINIREIPAGTPGSAGPTGFTGSAAASGGSTAAAVGYSLVFGG
jgi:collagen type VII alpha